MPGPDQSANRRRGTARRAEFLPRIVEAFVELGYRRATTAELAARCGVRENELYRIWPGKRQMFLAAIDHVYAVSAEQWREKSPGGGDATPAGQLLDYQARSRGHSQLHRIVFSGLSETDDPEIRAALRRLYRRFHRLLVNYVQEHRDRTGVDSPALDAAQTAWAVIGIASIFDIRNDLNDGSLSARRELLRAVTSVLLDGNTPDGRTGSAKAKQK